MSYYYTITEIEIRIKKDLPAIEQALCGEDGNFEAVLEMLNEKSGFDVFVEDDMLHIEATEPQKYFDHDFIDILSIAGLIEDESYLEVIGENDFFGRYVWRTGHHAVLIFPLWPAVPVDQRCQECDSILSVDEEPLHLCQKHYELKQKKEAEKTILRAASLLIRETDVAYMTGEKPEAYIQRVFSIAPSYWQKGGWKYRELEEAFSILGFALP